MEIILAVRRLWEMRNWLRNSKALILSIAGTVGVKGLSLLISLFTTAAYMHYFVNQEILGVWLALVSMLNWIITFDLGIGNGLRNKLVEALSSGDREKVRQCLSSAYVILGIISIAILVVGNVALRLIDWNRLLNISEDTLSAGTLVLAVCITFSGVVLQFFLRLVLSILYAMQRPAIANLIALISHSLILIFVWLFRVESVEQSLIILSFMQAITVNLPLIAATAWVFWKLLGDARPGLRHYIPKLARDILSLGYQFFWIQLALLVINSTNDFLIARLFGPNYVVEYQIYDKVFILISSGFSLVTVPVWSAVTKAMMEKRTDWIKKTYLMLIGLGAAVCAASFVLPLLYQDIVNIWLKDRAIQVSLFHAYMFAVYNSVLVINYASTSIANGMGILSTQMKCNTAAAILKIPLVYLLAQFTNDWICVIWVNIFIMLPCALIQPVVIRQKLKGV